MTASSVETRDKKNRQRTMASCLLFDGLHRDFGEEVIVQKMGWQMALNRQAAAEPDHGPRSILSDKICHAANSSPTVHHKFFTGNQSTRL